MAMVGGYRRRPRAAVLGAAGVVNEQCQRPDFENADKAIELEGTLWVTAGSNLHSTCSLLGRYLQKWSEWLSFRRNSAAYRIPPFFFVHYLTPSSLEEVPAWGPR